MSAMRDRLRKAWADEFVRQPLPPLRWVALSQWRQMLPALEARVQRRVPIVDFWLPSLLDELSRRLDGALEIREEGPLRTITALGFVSYTIDREAKTVSSTLLASPPIQIDPHHVDVVCAWSRLGWLSPLLGQLRGMQLVATLLPPDHRPALRARLVRMLTPMLRRDDRFLRLRRDLRRALRFDPELVRLALRTRNVGAREGLRGSRLIEVWQHEAYLRVVERDAPRLLPLAFSVLPKLIKAPASEALKGLKALLAACGLTDVGWRYLLRHGVRGISESGGGRLTVEEVAQMAQALAMAGGHPPPSAALRRAWGPRFVRIAEFGAEHRHTLLTWLTSERRLAGAILKAANEAKRTPAYPRFVDGVTGVLWWLRDAKLATSRKSLRTLIRAAKAWEEDQLEIARTGHRRWSRPRSVPCPDGIHEAVLLDGPAAVLEEARAMRNCLRTRLTVLASGRIRMWSVRVKPTGGRVALIEAALEGDRWTIGQIAGRFNRPAPAWVKAFAETLAVCESARHDSTGEDR